ncbi:MAG: hypothetical protein JWP14_3246 [Frankiales bacterium]|nr:hypothetical protein [Frankiales bacterium]
MQPAWAAGEFAARETRLKVLSVVVPTLTRVTTPNVPSPLGFCASCLVGGHRRVATAMLEGTGSCDLCTLEAMHIHDGEERAQLLHSLRVQDASEGLGG